MKPSPRTASKSRNKNNYKCYGIRKNYKNRKEEICSEEEK